MWEGGSLGLNVSPCFIVPLLDVALLDSFHDSLWFYTPDR